MQREKKETRQSVRRLFLFRVDRARESISRSPNISPLARGLHGPMHSRIAFLADSYVAVLHNWYVRMYIHTYIWELRVESTTIGEQLTRCPTDQSVLSVVELALVVRRAISKIAPRHTMTTGSDIAGPSTSGSVWKPQRQRLTTYRDSCHGRWATNRSESPRHGPWGTRRPRPKKMENRRRRKSNRPRRSSGQNVALLSCVYTYMHVYAAMYKRKYTCRSATWKLLWALTEVSASFRGKFESIQFDIVCLTPDSALRIWMCYTRDSQLVCHAQESYSDRIKV